MANFFAELFGLKKNRNEEGEQTEALAMEEYRLESMVKDVLSIGRYLLRNMDAELQVEIGPNVPSVLLGESEKIRKRFEGIVQKAISINRGALVRILISFRATEWKKGEICFDIIISDPEETFTYTVEQSVVDYRPFTEINELSDEDEEVGFQVADTKILVIDDNKTLLKMAKQMISQYGCEVVCASSGEEGLRKIREDFFQLVFLDLMMPQMDGFEVAAKIRSLGGEFRRIPIVALSGNAVVNSQGRCFEVGMDDYLSKPMHMDCLGEVLRKYIKKDKISAVKQTQMAPEVFDTPQRQKFLSKLIGFDVKEGLKLCMGDTSIYISVVKSYYEDSLEGRIEQAYIRRDWENYTIYVHALKSTSRSIGAMRLGEMAYQLEMAGKRRDEGFISENHVVCMDVYREHLQTIREAMKDLNEEKPRIKPAEHVSAEREGMFDRFLKELFDALDEMNPQKIEEAVAGVNLVSFRHPDSNRIWNLIKNLTENYDFIEAKKKLEELASLEKQTDVG